MTAVGAATEGATLTGAVVQARASIEAALGDTEASVEAEATMSAPTEADRPVLPPAPWPSRPPPPPPSNGANETTPEENETAPSQPQSAPPPSNETRVTVAEPAKLEPHEQDVNGQPGAPLRFLLLLTNHADVAQNVTLQVRAPVGWDVRISPERALLGPDETVSIAGTVVTPHVIGTLGTVSVRATGPGGDDMAFVDVCTGGSLPSGGCRARSAPERNVTTTSEPSANETASAEPAPTEGEPSANKSTSGQTSTNETGTTPEPQPEAEPEAESAAPTNETPTGDSTGGSPSNTTSSGNSTGEGSKSGASAEAWITIEASASDDNGEAATTEEEDDESPPAVTVDL